MKNSYGLVEGMVVFCKSNYYHSNGDYYFEKGKKYIIVEKGYNQTHMKEIFMQCDSSVRYIWDIEFGAYFEIDKQSLRKEKIKKINGK